MKIAFIMDPLEGVKAHKDTTYYIMLAARQRQHQVFYLDQNDLLARHDRLYAELTPVDVHADIERPFTKHDSSIVPMDEMDAVMVRTDPPFDRRYFYTTLLLDLLPPTTVVVNRPRGLRNWNEKLSALHFARFNARTLVTRRKDQILEFMEESGKRVTLKPVDGFGGRGVVFLDPGGPNNDQLINLITHNGSHMVIVQDFIPEARTGDKRILLLNGEPLGAVLRKAPKGKELNNLDAGGSAHPAEITPFEREMCAQMKQGMLDQGILLGGIDILGDRLIEINVTSPTCLQELCRFTGKDFHHDIVAAVETLSTEAKAV
ncbi:MAG: glutathione synthase [Acidobacteriota bacterium]|nr:glutathione synthase [Acidobacteriota bacterium]